MFHVPPSGWVHLLGLVFLINSFLSNLVLWWASVFCYFLSGATADPPRRFLVDPPRLSSHLRSILLSFTCATAFPPSKYKSCVPVFSPPRQVSPLCASRGSRPALNRGASKLLSYSPCSAQSNSGLTPVWESHWPVWALLVINLCCIHGPMWWISLLYLGVG